METQQGQLQIRGVSVGGGACFHAPAVLLTTGTFLRALMHMGEAKTAGGRAGEGTTSGISGALNRLGFRTSRFKTGTPPRLNGRTIDYAATEIQPGDQDDAAVQRTPAIAESGSPHADSQQPSAGPDVFWTDPRQRTPILSIDRG